MKALSIEMVNFRQFERFECKFDPNFTLLMGQNGTGKTNLLQAMAIALSAPFNQIGLREVTLEEGDVRRDRGRGADDLCFPAGAVAECDCIGVSGAVNGCRRLQCGLEFRD